MNCHQVSENLSAFNDRELDMDQTNAIKAHLIRCPSCRRKRDEMEEIGRRIRHLTPLTAPEDFQFRVYGAIRRHQAKKTRRHILQWQTVVIPAAALIIGIVIGVSTPVFNPVTSRDTLIASESPSDDAAYALAFLDENDVIKEYSLDRYVQGSLVPVNVDIIPDNADDAASGRATYTRNAAQGSVSHPQYVLDNVPIRVNYERTIY